MKYFLTLMLCIAGFIASAEPARPILFTLEIQHKSGIIETAYFAGSDNHLPSGTDTKSFTNFMIGSGRKAWDSIGFFRSYSFLNYPKDEYGDSLFAIPEESFFKVKAGDIDSVRFLGSTPLPMLYLESPLSASEIKQLQHKPLGIAEMDFGSSVGLTPDFNAYFWLISYREDFKQSEIETMALELVERFKHQCECVEWEETNQTFSRLYKEMVQESKEQGLIFIHFLQ